MDFDFSDRHPSTLAILRFFLRGRPARKAPMPGFLELAALAVDTCPDGPELTAGLRKLLEARDCFDRAYQESLMPPVDWATRADRSAAITEMLAKFAEDEPQKAEKMATGGIIENAGKPFLMGESGTGCVIPSGH